MDNIKVPFPRIGGHDTGDMYKTFLETFYYSDEYTRMNKKLPLIEEILNFITSHYPQEYRKVAQPRAIVFMDGNIGAGKTTLLRSLASHEFLTDFGEKKAVPIVTVLEPVDKFTQELNDFYLNKNETNAINLELRIILENLRSFVTAVDKKEYVENEIIIFERGIHSTQFFVEANRAIYSGDKYRILQSTIACAIEFANRWLSVLHRTAHFLVYLRSNPVECLKRVKQRSRETEEFIALEYIKALDMVHDKFYGVHPFALPVPEKGTLMRAIFQIILPEYELGPFGKVPDYVMFYLVYSILSSTRAFVILKQWLQSR